MTKKALFIILIFWSAIVTAEIVYQTPEDFIANNLVANYSKKSIWLSKSQKEIVKNILQIPYTQSRYYVWQDAKENQAFIISYVAKNKPFTMGFIVHKQKIIYSKILIYREIHGGQVANKYFLQQFDASYLNDDLTLSTNIDGITGASLSVAATKRMARLALYLAKVK